MAFRWSLTLAGLAAYCTPVLAQPAPPPETQAAQAASLEGRAAQLPDIFTGKLELEDYFTPEFLAAVPPAQLRVVMASVLAQHGAPQGIDRVERIDALRGTAYVHFARSVGALKMVLDPAQGGKVSGLLISDFTSVGDSMAIVERELAALPGQTNYLVVRLDGPAPAELHARNPDLALAIGSTFKLYVLAELSDRIERRKMAWDNVSDIDRRSFSSKATEHWPMGAPVTLHSLASWMISVSDNGATDMMIDVLGRDAIGRRLMAIGNSVAERNVPFLNTVEAFALKSPKNDDVRVAFLAAGEAEQGKLLARSADRLTLDAISGELFVGKPLHIDSIEWFASPRDLVRLMNHFRAEKRSEARGIMAINPGISREAAARWQYLGYKGGSEAGVISMSFLLQSKAGRWYAVTGSWNDGSAPVDNEQFAALMRRMVDQIALQDAAIVK
jgi:hypothetical protein